MVAPERQNVIFVLGDGHIESFAELLGSEGIASVVTERHIGVNPEDDALMATGLRYLQEHPDCVNEF